MAWHLLGLSVCIEHSRRNIIPSCSVTGSTSCEALGVWPLRSGRYGSAFSMA